MRILLSLISFLALSACQEVDTEALAAHLQDAANAPTPTERFQATAKGLTEVSEKMPTALSDWLRRSAAGEQTTAIPAELESLWATACPGLSTQDWASLPPLSRRSRIYSDCAGPFQWKGDVLGTLSSDAHLQFAAGDPTLALITGQWMREMELSSALTEGAVAALIGELIFKGASDLVLPDLQVAATEWSPPTLVVTPSGVQSASGEALLSLTNGQPANGLGERNQPWAIPTLTPALGTDTLVAVHPEVPWTTTARVLASAQQDTVQLLVRGTQQGQPAHLAMFPLTTRSSAATALEFSDKGVVVRDSTGTWSPTSDCTHPGQTLCASTKATDSFTTTFRLAELATLLQSKGVTQVTASLPQGTPTRDYLALAHALATAAEGAISVSPSTAYAPCETAIAGTACIPGGALAFGGDTGREVTLPTFYLDQREVRVDEYQSCVDAKFCRPFSGLNKMAADLPVHGMPFTDARRYCSWVGKRLPTEYEWEFAATRETSLWTDSGLKDCNTTHHKGCDTGPRAVSTKASGMVDLTGNVAEWTSTWREPSLKACGTGCTGADPQGFCDGAWPCPIYRGFEKDSGYTIMIQRDKFKKVARGGSWKKTTSNIRATERISVSIQGQSDVGIRCALDRPVLSKFPPRNIANPYPVRPLTEPPTQEQRNIASSIEEDNLGVKDICGDDVRSNWADALRKGGRSTTVCRDPYSYVTTNEPKIHGFHPYLKNIGGAYIGIGSTQNYDFIAAARPDWAWVVDYDPNVVRLHHVLVALIPSAKDPASFVALFSKESRKQALDIIEKVYADDPDKRIYQAFYTGYQARLHKHYTRRLTPRAADPEFGWLAKQENYEVIHTLASQGRMVAVGGDLLATKTMQNLGKAAKALNVPVRIYYTSNAPTAWGAQITDNYRDNVLSLPMDEHSLVLSTYNWGAYGQKDKWHYSVMWGPLFQERITLPGHLKMYQLIWDRIPTDDHDVTILGVPSH